MLIIGVDYDPSFQHQRAIRFKNNKFDNDCQTGLDAAKKAGARIRTVPESRTNS